MSIISKLGRIGKFIMHYADEANAVANAFKAILPAIPINSADKAKITKAIAKLENASEAIEKSLSADPSLAEPVKVKASDVKAGIAAYFKSAEGKKAIADAVKAATK